MGNLAEFKPKSFEKLGNNLPKELYIVKEFDEELGDFMYLAFDHISCIREGDVVGVYDLSDIKVKRESHSLV